MKVPILGFAVLIWLVLILIVISFHPECKKVGAAFCGAHLFIEFKKLWRDIEFPGKKGLAFFVVA
ncbi:hypothetical protein SDC9_85190 [bioreactor metagenome]|uniref:Uncharacterized protein n=1 Tax=bioreactor metagenome TaxID=1076179 RepID=A0A644ZF92_9ZZZZ